MYNGKHISIGRVLYRAMRHPNASDLTEEMAAEYAFELIRKLGIALSYKDDTAYRIIRTNKVKLPNNLIYLRGIRYHVNNQAVNDIIEQSKEEDDKFYESIETYLREYTNWLPVKYTGNIYQSSYHCEDYLDYPCTGDITYTINNNYVTLSEPEGAIEISYRALVLDDKGLPMIPDNQPFEDCLYYYILKEHFFPLIGVGKISQYFYEKIEQEYAWAAGKAQNSLMLAGMDHWEATMNGIRRLIQYDNFSDYGFSDMHRKERIRKTF